MHSHLINCSTTLFAIVYNTHNYVLLGEKMLVLKSTLQGSDWWLVKSLLTEKEGYIPSNYVESSYKSQE